MKMYLTPLEFCKFDYSFRAWIAKKFDLVREDGNVVSDNILVSDGHSGQELMKKFNMETIVGFLGKRANGVDLRSENALEVLIGLLQEKFCPKPKPSAHECAVKECACAKDIGKAFKEEVKTGGLNLVKINVVSGTTTTNSTNGKEKPKFGGNKKTSGNKANL